MFQFRKKKFTRIMGVSLDDRASILLEKDNAGQTCLMLAKTAVQKRLLLAMAKTVGCENELLKACDTDHETVFYIGNTE